MKNILLLNKKEGETPLEALEGFRKKNSGYKDVKMTYAGRLDPMASGLLLLLAGEETRNKEKYLNLEKEYDFEVLFGFATDTHDILGKVVSAKAVLVEERKGLEKKIKDNLRYFTGRFKQKYPIYSSKTVNGKPLFTYARKEKKVKAPEHEIHVKSLKFLKLKEINAGRFLENIERRIAKVNGDFRQKEILKIWRNNLRKPMNFFGRFFLASFKIKCGSGTYVRSIANDLGQKMGIPALAFSIKRTKIGKYIKIQS